MKNALFTLLFVTLVSSVSAQSARIGVKGGLNFGATGDITTITNDSFNGENRAGYHLGLLGKFKFAGIFLQPEIVYTSLQTEYGNTVDSDYDLQKIDVPVLLGFEIVGPLNIKAGPAFQYILDNGFDVNNFATSDPEDSVTFGYQVGAGLELGKLGIDLRYEGAFSENNSILTGSEVAQFGTIDNRPTQWIISVSYFFGNK